MADVEALLELYSAVQEKATGTSNDPLWEIGVHPSRADLEEAINDGGLLVLRDENTLVGTIILNTDAAEGYDAAPWLIEATSEEVQVVHLFAIHPDYQGQGLARKLLEASYELAKQRGAKALRLDTLLENKGAQRTYEALGFDRIGEYRLYYPTLEAYKSADDQRFVLYEKSLA